MRQYQRSGLDGRVLRLLAVLSLLTLSACAGGSVAPGLSPEVKQMYGEVQDGDILIPAVPAAALTERNRRQIVDYYSSEAPGTIVVDPYSFFLYYVLPENKAIRYGIAVGEQGYGFSGRANVQVKREWPSWTPTANMIRRDPDQYGPWSGGMQGGLQNPLGARALYLYRGGRDTLYRIHGTNDVYSIGKATSAGCIRLFNQDSLDLYARAEPGTPVTVLSPSESVNSMLPPDLSASLETPDPDATVLQ